MSVIKRSMAIILVIAMIFSMQIQSVFATTNYQEPNNEMIEAYQLETDKIIVGNDLHIRLKLENQQDTPTKVHYQTEDGRNYTTEGVYNSDNGLVDFTIPVDRKGVWKLLSLQIGDAIYDGRMFHRDFIAYQRMEEAIHEGKAVLNTEVFQEGMHLTVNEFFDALTKIQAMKSNGEWTDFSVQLVGNNISELYAMEYNKGYELSQSTPYNPEVGNYKVKITADNGLQDEKNISIISDASKSEYVYLSGSVELSALDMVKRLSGGNREETAISISKESRTSATNVIITSGYNFPDALSAVSYATQMDAPILFANSKGISKATIDEINRLGAVYVYIIGGVNSVGSTAATALRNEGIVVKRIAGSNRFSTAIRVAQELRDIKLSNTAILVDAAKYPDALSAGSYSGSQANPILYTGRDVLNETTKNFIVKNGISNIIIVGGTNSVSNRVKQQLENMGIETSRVSGQNRYETSINFAKKYFNNTSDVVIASGGNFPDALAGGVLAANHNAPILLTNVNQLPSATDRWISESNIENVYVLGGERGVSKSIFSNLSRMTKVVPPKKPEEKKPELVKAPVKNIPPRVPTKDNPIRIMLDPGHGWNANIGIMGYSEGTTMYYYGHKLKKALEQYGFVVGITRNDIEREKYMIENFGTFKDGISLEERGKMGKGYDLLISLHSNYTDPKEKPEVRGTEVWDSVTTPNKALAEKIANAVSQTFGHVNRGVKYKMIDTSWPEAYGKNWYGVLRHSLATHSMLVEHGFHSNKEDTTLLQDDAFLDRLAEAEAKAIADFYGMPVR